MTQSHWKVLRKVLDKITQNQWWNWTLRNECVPWLIFQIRPTLYFDSVNKPRPGTRGSKRSILTDSSTKLQILWLQKEKRKLKIKKVRIRGLHNQILLSHWCSIWSLKWQLTVLNKPRSNNASPNTTSAALKFGETKFKKLLRWTSLHHIWIERNYRKFQNAFSPHPVIIDKICSDIRCRMLSAQAS